MKGERNIHAFEQVILIVGTKYKMIASHTVTENPYATESPYLKPSFDQVKNTYSSVKSLSGDAAFLSRENVSLIAAAGAGSVNSAFQRMFEKKLTRRTRSRRKTETLARIYNFNLKRFCYLRYLEPHLFRSQNPLN